MVHVIEVPFGLDHGVGHFRSLSITLQRHLLVYHGIAMRSEDLRQVFWQLFFHQNSLHFNHLQTYFYFNDLQEKQQNQIVINKGYFVMIFNKPAEALE